jgi:hypothetical protein
MRSSSSTSDIKATPSSRSESAVMWLSSSATMSRPVAVPLPVVARADWPLSHARSSAFSAWIATGRRGEFSARPCPVATDTALAATSRARSASRRAASGTWTTPNSLVAGRSLRGALAAINMSTKESRVQWARVDTSTLSCWTENVVQSSARPVIESTRKRRRRIGWHWSTHRILSSHPRHHSPPPLTRPRFSAFFEAATSRTARPRFYAPAMASSPSYCRDCGTMLLGDVEPTTGVCWSCALPPEVRPKRTSTWRRPLKKALTYVCQACGAEGEQGRMGRPRLFCPSCDDRVSRRRRARAAAA